MVSVIEIFRWTQGLQGARAGSPTRQENDAALESGASRALDPQNRESILAARIFMVLSASIVFTLGVVHLVYTFWGTKLTPRDPALQISMSQIAPVITKETTMWRCWVGFNASHSMGLILFGLVFGFLALAHGELLFQSPFLLVVGLAMLGRNFLFDLENDTIVHPSRLFATL